MRRMSLFLVVIFLLPGCITFGKQSVEYVPKDDGGFTLTGENVRSDQLTESIVAVTGRETMSGALEREVTATIYDGDTGRPLAHVGDPDEFVDYQYSYYGRGGQYSRSGYGGVDIGALRSEELAFSRRGSRLPSLGGETRVVAPTGVVTTTSATGTVLSTVPCPKGRLPSSDAERLACVEGDVDHIVSQIRKP